MKKLFLSMILLALPLLVSAYDAVVDGIYYNLNSEEKTAEVAYQLYDDYNHNYYSDYYGFLTIPEKFTYEGVDFYVTSIGNHAFENCRGLTSVIIPNSVTSIGSDAFFGCNGLTSVNIPNTVTYIGDSAFRGCNGLTSVIIPKSVTRINDFTFYDCSGLSSVIIPNSVTIIGWDIFHGCSGLTSVTIPNSVTRIGRGDFLGCSSLTSVTIPNSVTIIERDAFSGCSSLTSVTIPNSVTSIGKTAFANCYKLEEVYCYTSLIPSTNNDAFENSGIQFATLYVHADMVKAFKTVAPWSEFGTIKSLEESGINPNPDPSDSQCAAPTISYAEKRLTFSCETEGVEYHYTITDSDIKSDVSSSIDLSATYNISVYATKSGYTNSDVATATLVWTDAIFTETTPETPTSAKAVQESIPVLISAKGGNISVKCEADGQEVNVYTIDGLSLGTATVKNGEALISTSIPSGDIAVVKVGGRSVKVIMR